GVEQAQGRLEHRRVLDGVEGHLLHQLLELFGQGGLAAADRTEQVEDLLLLLEALGGMAEEGDDLFDAVLHAVEVGESRVATDDLVGKDPRQAWIGGGVDQLRFTDGHQHALGGAGVGARVLLAQIQVFLQGEFFLAFRFEALLEVAEDAHVSPRSSHGAGAARSCGCWTPAEASVRSNPPEPKVAYAGSRWSGSSFFR